MKHWFVLQKIVILESIVAGGWVYIIRANTLQRTCMIASDVIAHVIAKHYDCL